MIKQRGDTIVEVMIAMTIIGLVMASAFAVANRSYAVGISAQERTDALAVADTQLELVRTLSNQTPNIISNSTRSNPLTPPPLFCVNPSTGVIDTFTLANFSSGAAITDNPLAYPAACRVGPDGKYKISIKQLGPVFDIRVRWDSILDANQDEVNHVYRTYDFNDTFTLPIATVDVCPNISGNQVAIPVGLIVDVSGNCVAPLVPATINLVVRKIPPAAGNNTPSCSSAATVNRSGTSVQLNGVNGTTNSSSTATFNNLNTNTAYSASAITAPAGHQLCPPTTATVTSGASGSIVNSTVFKIRPVCYSYQSGTTPGYWTYGARRVDADNWYYVLDTNGIYTIPWIAPPGGIYKFVHSGSTGADYLGNPTAYYYGYNAVYVNGSPIYSNYCP